MSRPVVILAAAVAAFVVALAGAAVGTGANRVPRPGFSLGHAGWPVWRVDRQHPIRGAFLDPRAGATGLVFHTGVDISVRDDLPERRHPAVRTHRVYALTGGTAEMAQDVVSRRCSGRLVRVGRFTYAHVDPVGVVARGQQIEPGDVIGWTCRGLWHLHLSERTTLGGVEVLVNPLRPGGILRPYVDATPPVIHEFSFTRRGTPEWHVENGAYVSSLRADEIDASALNGVVAAHVWAGDPETMEKWPSLLHELDGEHAPAQLRVTLRRVADGAVLWNHVVFDASYLRPSGVPAIGTFAPGTTQNLPAQQCLSILPVSCAGHLWFALGPPGASVWDTRAYRNGAYELCVDALDPLRNAARACRTVTIAN